MTDSAQRLKDEVLRLSAEDREELARILWDSLRASDSDIDEDEAAWIAELDRRTADLEAGRATAEPFRDVIEELREEALQEKKSR
jgi:putative addiction module component (TIGR02574 family)